MVFIPPWVEQFLHHLKRTGLPATAAEAAGTTLKAVESWRNESMEFDEAYNEVLELNIDQLELTARDRAINGWEEPVFYQGEECGTVTKFDNGLLRWLIEGNRNKYKPSIKHTGADGGPLTVFVRNFDDMLPEATTQPTENDHAIIDAEFTQHTSGPARGDEPAGSVDDLV